MPTEQPKRLKTIKVRVTESELASLRAACPKAQLAEWGSPQNSDNKAR